MSHSPHPPDATQSPDAAARHELENMADDLSIDLSNLSPIVAHQHALGGVTEVPETGEFEHHSPAIKGSLNELLLVAAPLVISMGSESIMQLVDRMYLSWYSKEAYAAAMPGGIFSWTASSIPFGMMLYTNAFVAQYYGAKQGSKIVTCLGQSIYLAILCGFFMTTFSLWAETLFQIVDHEPAIQTLEIQYFKILTVGSFPMLLMVCLQGFFSGRGQTRYIMYANLAECSFNIIFDYIMIFGWGPIPAMGIQGAAYATITSRILSCGIIFYFISQNSKWAPDGLVYPFKNLLRFDYDVFIRMLRHGFSTGLQFFVDVIGFAVLFAVLGQLGEVPLTATNLAFQLNSLAFIPMFGLGTAVSILVGQRIGERNIETAQKTIRMALALVMIYMGVWCISYLTIPEVLMSPFLMTMEKEDPAYAQSVKDMVTILLRFVVVYSLFDGLAIIYNNAIRGAGDTTFPIYYVIIASFVMLICPLLVLKYYDMVTLNRCWMIVTGYIMVQGLGMWGRYLTGIWKSKSLIHAPAAPH